MPAEAKGRAPSSHVRASLPSPSEDDPDETFSTGSGFGDATAADMPALPYPSHLAGSEDVDATSIERMIGQDSVSPPAEFGGKTETWSGLAAAAELEPTPLFQAEVIPSVDLDRTMATGEGFGDRTESWSSPAPSDFDEASDGTMEGVTLEPELDGGADFGDKTEAFLATMSPGPFPEEVQEDEEPTRSKATPPPSRSNSGVENRESRAHSSVLPAELMPSQAPSSSRSPAAGDGPGRPMRLPTKPAIEHRGGSRAASLPPKPREAPPPEEQASESEDVKLEGQRNPLIIAVALISVIVLFVAGFLASHFF